VRNPATWFQLGVNRDAIEPGFDLALFGNALPVVLRAKRV